MTELDIEEVKRQIDKYFATATKEEIHQDLVAAGLELYSKCEDYREGDLDAFLGCAPRLTGDLSTEEFIEKIRGKAG